MMSFHKKIFCANLILLIVLGALLFPFVEKGVVNLLRHAVHNRIVHLGQQLQQSADIDDAIQLLNTRGRSLFLQMYVADSKGHILYDSKAVEEAVDEHPHRNELYTISNYPFQIQGEKYILRIGFPAGEMRKFAADFEIGFLAIGIFILVLYSIITWFIIQCLCRPIQQIINAILPYQEGREEFLPRVVMGNFPMQGDEFSKLAFTLNSLSERVQKEIEHFRRQRMETEGILESLSEGVIALTPHGKISFTNKVACQILGASHDEIMGQTLDQIATKKMDLARKGHELVLQVLQTSEPIIQTWTQKSGSRLHLNLIAAPLAHQNGAILVLQDTTSDYKVLEMGKDFIANASHELRTPITVIRGFAETLQDLPHLSKAMLHEITDKIVRTCIRLDKLVKSLLTLSDLENLSLNSFQRVNLILLIENCKNFILTAHPTAQISFNGEMPQILISADSDLLELAIINLLENAVKYSPDPAGIDILVRQEGAEVFIDIKDHGIGIPQSDIPHIFDRFYTVDKARSRKSGGAGLGLSIVKTIIEKHYGRIFVTSEIGKGSHFTISLPLIKNSQIH